MAGDLYTGATQSLCPQTVDTVRHHMLMIVAVPSSSTMYLRGTIWSVVFMTEEKTRRSVFRLTPAMIVW
jgi:hypothetical protein